MAIKLAYPTLTAPTTLITLPDCEQLPSSRPSRTYQTQFETDAGAVVVYDFGGNSSTFTLNLYPLSAAQVASIESFFLTTVNGRAIDWQLEDSLGNQYDVKFAQDVIEAQQRGVSNHALAITLRVI